MSIALGYGKVVRMKSPFLELPESNWIASNAEAFAIFDSYPVSPGHVLVVTKRLVPTWFDTTPQEQLALMELVNRVKIKLDQTLNPKPDGYNVGFNAGDAAGQTVPHVHVHVIPRYRGDVDDPRGGVRHVIPQKGNYLAPKPMPPESIPTLAGPQLTGPQLSAGHPNSPLWQHLSWRIPGARCVDVLASFVQMSGLDVIENCLFEAIRNHALIRILVSDYLYISDPRALGRLLGWVAAADEVDPQESSTPRLYVRLIEMAKIPSKPASFHPKAWRIADELNGFIAIGSSNLSRPALESGIEWNLLATRNEAPEADAQMAVEFESLWLTATPLTNTVVENYTGLAQQYRVNHFEPESIATRESTFLPRPWQVEALRSLNEIRSVGYCRALVAVATGMGKTWLAAFDIEQVGRQLGRRPRVLVIAHRAHMLAQAETAISQVLDASFSLGTTTWYVGNQSRLDGDLVIASIQKLMRPAGLDALSAEHFDYVMVDEVHHAHAPSYRRVLARCRGDFVLGLTATPERSDGVDVATIFDDNLAYQATIGDGIEEESLVPFHYIGLKDSIDFRQIPWRNGRFEFEVLEDQVASSERMTRLWRAMQTHQTSRTLIFCCSRRHALFVRDWLRAKGNSSAAVFSGSGGDSYSESLQQLREGNLQSLCVVDMFNEGLDIPAVDRVVMLRPTESKVLFLQQLGRGLRASEGKSRLIVIDFVGNHRIFAQRMIHLLSLKHSSEGWGALKEWLSGKPPILPAGCLLDVEIDVQDVLRQFLPQGRTAGIEGYRALRDDLGRRPSMLEVFNREFLPRTISAASNCNNWFAFVAAEGDLSEAEQTVAATFSDWFTMLEVTQLTKSYKMVVLRVLLDEQRLFEGMDLSTLSAACRRFLQQHPVLRRDLDGERHAIDHERADPREWEKWWLKWPIDRWLDLQKGQSWFVVENNLFRLQRKCEAQFKPCLEALTEEMVDWRLAAYAKSHRLAPSNEGELAFVAKVSHSQGRPILFIPDKAREPARPTGPVTVQLPDGRNWEFKFVKVACNVAGPQGEKANQLGELLRDWFGPNAGLPGTDYKVQFETKNQQWFACPMGIATEEASDSQIESAASNRDTQQEAAVTIIEPKVGRAAEYTTHVPVYDVSAAAGYWGPEGQAEQVGWIRVPHQALKKGMFAVQVIGDSMEPKIPSGAICLFRPCPAGSREGRLLLVQVNTHELPEEGGRYTVKRYHSQKRATDEGWVHQIIELEPLNPAYKPIVINAEDADSVRVIGEFIGVVQ